MTSLGTDFEMHAIRQGYVEYPAAKDFVARKARTIALCKRKEPDNQPWFTSWKSLGDSISELYCKLSEAYVMQESVSSRIFVSKKGWFAFAQWTFAPETFGKRWKASCFEKPTCTLPEIWGCMYNVLPRSAKGTRSGMRNRIPVQPRKAQKQK